MAPHKIARKNSKATKNTSNSLEVSADGAPSAVSVPVDVAGDREELGDNLVGDEETSRKRPATANLSGNASTVSGTRTNQVAKAKSSWMSASDVNMSDSVVSTVLPGADILETSSTTNPPTTTGTGAGASGAAGATSSHNGTTRGRVASSNSSSSTEHVVGEAEEEAVGGNADRSKKRWTKRPQNWREIVDYYNEQGLGPTLAQYPAELGGYTSSARYQSLYGWKKKRQAEIDQNLDIEVADSQPRGRMPVYGREIDELLVEAVLELMAAGYTTSYSTHTLTHTTTTTISTTTATGSSTTTASNGTGSATSSTSANASTAGAGDAEDTLAGKSPTPTTSTTTSSNESLRSIVDDFKLRDELVRLLEHHGLDRLLVENGGANVFQASWAQRFWNRNGQRIRINMHTRGITVTSTTTRTKIDPDDAIAVAEESTTKVASSDPLTTTTTTTTTVDASAAGAAGGGSIGSTAGVVVDAGAPHTKGSRKSKEWNHRPSNWMEIAQFYINSKHNLSETIGKYPDLLGNLSFSAAYQKLHSWRQDVESNRIPKPTGRSAEYGPEVDHLLVAEVRREMAAGVVMDDSKLRALLLQQLESAQKLHLLREHGGSCTFGHSWSVRFRKRHDLQSGLAAAIDAANPVAHRNSFGSSSSSSNTTGTTTSSHKFAGRKRKLPQASSNNTTSTTTATTTAAAEGASSGTRTGAITMTSASVSASASASAAALSDDDSSDED